MRARKGFWWRSFVAVENNCGAHGAPSQYRAAPRRSQRFGELSASLRLLKMSKLQLKIQWFLRSRIIEAGRWGRPNYAWWCACEPTTTHTPYTALFVTQHGHSLTSHLFVRGHFHALNYLLYSPITFLKWKAMDFIWLNKTCLDRTLPYLRLLNLHHRVSLLMKNALFKVYMYCMSMDEYISKIKVMTYMVFDDIKGQFTEDKRSKCQLKI